MAVHEAPMRPDPPPEVELGTPITRFHGWVQSQGTSVKGYLTFTLGVPMSQKWLAMMMTDYPSQQLHFEVYLKAEVDQLNMLDEGTLDAALRAAVGIGDPMADAMDMTGPGEVKVDWNELDG